MHLIPKLSDEATRFLEDIRSNQRVLSMKKYIQHGATSTFRHCENVAAVSDYINTRFHLGGNKRTLLLGAMLHDFYLYDWHDGSAHARWHGFHHPKTAAENADRYFHADEATKEVIRSHMWPLTPGRIPRSKEGWIVCLADKYCALAETVSRRKK